MATNRLSAAQRAKRIGHQIQKELSDILKTLRDPRIPPLTIMAVDVSGDLSLAKVYVSALSIDVVDRAEIENSLTKAAGFVRTELGARLSIYNIPKLQFIYDTSVESGIELTKLIDLAVLSSITDAQDEDKQ